MEMENVPFAHHHRSISLDVSGVYPSAQRRLKFLYVKRVALSVPADDQTKDE
ncbi:hypothetical protein D9M73_140840 [compost metagenome]